MKVEFGVKVHVGNFYFLKYSKSLSKKDLAVLRKALNVPEDIKKHLQRGSLPYIKVSTVTGSWSVEFVVGTTMFDALDGLKVVVDDRGVRQLYGVEGKNTEAIFVAMLADTTTVGDYEYQVAKQKLLSEYLDRAGKKQNEKEDAGKSEEELRAESDAAAQEVLDNETHARTIVDMGEYLKQEEEKRDGREHGTSD